MKSDAGEFGYWFGDCTVLEGLKSAWDLNPFGLRNAFLSACCIFVHVLLTSFLALTCLKWCLISVPHPVHRYCTFHLPAIDWHQYFSSLSTDSVWQFRLTDLFQAQSLWHWCLWRPRRVLTPWRTSCTAKATPPLVSMGIVPRERGRRPWGRSVPASIPYWLPRLWVLISAADTIRDEVRGGGGGQLTSSRLEVFVVFTRWQHVVWTSPTSSTSSTLTSPVT